MSRQFLTFVAILIPNLAWAADWPSWRGPTNDGRSTETGFPLTWSATENVKWKTPLAGGGHSSPIVVGSKIFVTGCVESTRDRVLYCLDRKTGNILWEKTVLTSPLEGKHKLNSFASSTPASDGKHVYLTFYEQPQVRIFCYDHDGNKVWEKSPGPFHSKHGFCSSPLLYENLVIVNCDHDAPENAKPSYIVAFDKKTGDEKWRVDRPNRTRSYCPPVVFDVAGKKQMVLTGTKCVTSYDPATGKLNWIVDGPTEQFVSSMVMSDGLLFLTAGFPQYWVMAIRPDGSGNVTNTHIAWSKKNDGGYVPSPVAANGHFFLVTDEGLGSCWEAKTGKMKWKERLGKHHSGSAIFAENRVYFIADEGMTYVVNATDTFEVIAKNPLGERCYTSPAFSNGEIFIRGEKHLFCIGK